MFLWFVQEVAGLKEEDLPCDHSYLLLVTPASTLSESQYSTCTQVVTVVLL